jgi:hypothetical protein
VEKLQVRVLPCVLAFVGGVGVHRIIGFEGLGNGYKFTTKELESRLLQAGVLVRPKVDDEETFAVQSKSLRGRDADDDEDDWD